MDRLSFQEKGNVRDLMSALYGCNTLLGVCALYGCNTLFGVWSVVWIGSPSKMSRKERLNEIFAFFREILNEVFASQREIE